MQRDFYSLNQLKAAGIQLPDNLHLITQSQRNNGYGNHEEVLTHAPSPTYTYNQTLDWDLQWHSICLPADWLCCPTVSLSVSLPLLLLPPMGFEEGSPSPPAAVL